MSTTGERDGPPARAGGTPVDFLGGTHMHAGVMQAIIGREKTGKGTLVECAMIEALYFVLTSQITNVYSKGAQAPRRAISPVHRHHLMAVICVRMINI